MEDIFERLAHQLCDKNSQLTMRQARIWVEYLWEDFEATRAKAGREYEGKDTTERIVSQWINSYGPKLHEFISNNPRYQNLFEEEQDYLH
ncbi:YfhJ family protein [Pontibacillus salicampi]|uniref:YfhJ family protein n=1 Tax=Pontibacillus salicampi TaxID=1449801 RepID=A0ABV6LI21_9BACI